MSPQHSPNSIARALHSTGSLSVRLNALNALRFSSPLAEECTDWKAQTKSAKTIYFSKFTSRTIYPMEPEMLSELKRLTISGHLDVKLTQTRFGLNNIGI